MDWELQVSTAVQEHAELGSLHPVRSGMCDCCVCCCKTCTLSCLLLLQGFLEKLQLQEAEPADIEKQVHATACLAVCVFKCSAGSVSISLLG